ncbi:MAG: CAP domain-containing protein [Myxococcota bacterium]
MPHHDPLPLALIAGVLLTTGCLATSTPTARAVPQGCEAPSSTVEVPDAGGVDASYATSDDCVRWTFAGNAAPFTLDNDLQLLAEQPALGVALEADGPDPFMSVNASADLAECTVLEAVLSAESTGAAATGRFFWLTTTDTASWSAASSEGFPLVADGELRTHRVDLSEHPRWNGTLRQLRLDPLNGPGRVQVNTVALLRAPVGVDGGAGDAGCGACGAFAGCVAGVCECVPGFFRRDGVCVRSEGGLQSRTRGEVCAILDDGKPRAAAPVWRTCGGFECDLGALSPDARQDAVRRINMFRRLTGLPDVTYDDGHTHAEQECALILKELGGLSHDPPSATHCYTGLGAEAAGASNIALGVPSPSSAIDLYVDDRSESSLGHRRWLLNPPLDRVSVGHVDTFNCTRVHFFDGNADPELVAYPSPGPFPAEVLLGRWTVDLAAYELTDALEIVVVRQDTDEEVFRGGELLSGRFGSLKTVAYDPAWEVDVTYEVNITGLTRNGAPAEVHFSTQPVRCAATTNP